MDKDTATQWILPQLNSLTQGIRARPRWILSLVLIIATIQIYLTFGITTTTATTKDVITPSLERTLPLPMTLRERLLAHFPYDPKSGAIERNIIQTSKDTGFTNREVEMWKGFEGFNYLLFDDKEAYRLLLRAFGAGFPEIIEAYNSFPRKILKVDFFRYASIFLLGGTYSDTDTEPLKPLADWITYNKTVHGQQHDVGLVAGIEVECDCEKWVGISSRRVQLCQWTLQARKHHPAYAIILANIVDLMTTHYDFTQKKVTIGEHVYDFSAGQEGYYEGIMELTGPGMFTDSLFEYMNSRASLKIVDPNDHEEILSSLRHLTPEDTTLSVLEPRWSSFGWQNLTKIRDPMLVDDVLLLPQAYFNGKKEKKNPNSLIQHNYYGSWKSANGGLTGGI